LLVVLHLDDGEPMPLTRDGLPGRGSGVFALPTGAEMIVTLSPPRSRAAEKITPVDQPGGCRSYLQGMPGVYA
jgi:hypothetical protein